MVVLQGQPDFITDIKVRFTSVGIHCRLVETGLVVPWIVNHFEESCIKSVSSQRMFLVYIHRPQSMKKGVNPIVSKGSKGKTRGGVKH